VFNVNHRTTARNWEAARCWAPAAALLGALPEKTAVRVDKGYDVDRIRETIARRSGSRDTQTAKSNDWTQNGGAKARIGPRCANHRLD
jgi:IS5 family transposase